MRFRTGKRRELKRHRKEVLGNRRSQSFHDTIILWKRSGHPKLGLHLDASVVQLFFQGQTGVQQELSCLSRLFGSPLPILEEMVYLFQQGGAFDQYVNELINGLEFKSTPRESLRAGWDVIVGCSLSFSNRIA